MSRGVIIPPNHILIKARVLEQEAVSSTTESRQYNRGVSVHKLMYKALLQ